MCARNVSGDRLRAVELGGKLGGSSALASYGIWVDGDELIVVSSPTASRLPPTAPGEVRLWAKERFPEPSGVEWRVSVRDALLHLATAVDVPSLVASIDSALYTHRLQPSELASLIEALPRQLRYVRGLLDARAMSGTETKLRLACIRAGLKVELQASVARVGFVDLFIDDWLIIEVDSHKHHDEPIQQHKDRVRDGNAVLGGYGCLRFDYALVQFELDWCVEVILARLATGRP